MNPQNVSGSNPGSTGSNPGSTSGSSAGSSSQYAAGSQSEQQRSQSQSEQQRSQSQSEQQRSQGQSQSLARSGSSESLRRQQSYGQQQPYGYGQQRYGGLQRRGESPFGYGGGGYDLFRASPFSLMRRMTEEMERLFQDVGSDFEGQGRGGSQGWSPSIDVIQADNKILIQCEVPGVAPNDVKVEVDNDTLIIQGERRSEREQNERGGQRSERQYGAFFRVIPLPDGVNPEQITARTQNGLLEITIPTPQQRENRRSIPVEGGTQAGTQTGQTGQTETRRQAA
jgi:HSP20 family protein